MARSSRSPNKMLRDGTEPQFSTPTPCCSARPPFEYPGPFQLEAAIQSAHCQRLFSGHTPWKAIEFLYTALNATWPTTSSAVAHAAVLVELKREADAEALLAHIDRARVAEYAPYWVVLSHARRRSGDPAGARGAMTKAITLTRSPRLRTFLERTLAQL